MNASICHIVLGLAWVIWFYPFLFRAPLRQKRPSITVVGPTRIGLILETSAILFATAMHRPLAAPVPMLRFALALVAGAVGIQLGFGAVRHLGKQFRLHAGLYEDHELVRTGPYSAVRHPIYAALLAMLIMTILVLTPWQWAAVSVAIFLAGTEIRVRSEERLLASRFGTEFREYRKAVPAYLPFVR